MGVPPMKLGVLSMKKRVPPPAVVLDKKTGVPPTKTGVPPAKMGVSHKKGGATPVVTWARTS